MALHHPSRKSVEVLEEVTNAYAILHAPDGEDHEAYIQVYGRCHLETKDEIGAIQNNVGTISKRLNTLENASTIAPSPLSHSSSIDGVRYELSEMNDRLQDFEEATTRRLTDVEDLVTTVKDNLQELDNRIDGSEICLLERIDEVEQNMDGRLADLKSDINSLEKNTDRRFDDLEKNTDQRFNEVNLRFNNVDNRFDQFQLSVKGQFQNITALYQNGTADRFYSIVVPIGVEYQDLRGYTHYRFPPGPPQSVKYYWKLHRSRHYNKLLALYEFYQIPYSNWSTNDDSSDDDDNIEPLYCPLSLEAAIAKFPTKAVRILFARLGLVYSKFEEQAEKLQSLDQESGKTASKRASKRALPLGASRSKIRRQSPSTGSMTELPTSSTESRESHDSVALVGYDV